MAAHENAHGVRDRGRRVTNRESELSRTHGINDAAQRPIDTPSFDDAEFLARAGYEPMAMADFFARMHRTLRSTIGELEAPEFLRTHPVTSSRISEAKGKVKEVAGRIVGNEKLELKGKIENTAGKVQAAFGDAKADLKKAVHGK